jgi:hypothetical protein
MSRASGTQGGRLGFWWESQKGNDHKENPDVLILKLILEIGWGAMNSSDIALDRYRWMALVRTVMNFQVS